MLVLQKEYPKLAPYVRIRVLADSRRPLKDQLNKMEIFRFLGDFCPFSAQRNQFMLNKCAEGIVMIKDVAFHLANLTLSITGFGVSRLGFNGGSGMSV